MSEEKQIIEEKNETKCICRSKAFRKFAVIALGTFVGVYAALSLFAAVHRPCVPHHFGHYGMTPPAQQQFAPHKHHGAHHFKGKPEGKFQKDDFKKDFKGDFQPKNIDEDKD